MGTAALGCPAVRSTAVLRWVPHASPPLRDLGKRQVRIRARLQPGRPIHQNMPQTPPSSPSRPSAEAPQETDSRLAQRETLAPAVEAPGFKPGETGDKKWVPHPFAFFAKGWEACCQP